MSNNVQGEPPRPVHGVPLPGAEEPDHDSRPRAPLDGEYYIQW